MQHQKWKDFRWRILQKNEWKRMAYIHREKNVEFFLIN